MDKKQLKIGLIAVLAVVLIVGLVTLIRHQAEGSAYQRMMDEKIALVEAHAPEKYWTVISADGGWNEAHQMYEYKFTFRLGNNSVHATYTYANQHDLTEDTVQYLTYLDDGGFQPTPRKD